MKVKSRKKYAQSFKDQVVALVELGKPVTEVAQEMEVSRDLVYAWKNKASKSPTLGSGDAGAVGEQVRNGRASGSSPPSRRPPVGE